MRSLQCVKPAKRPALVAYTGTSKSHPVKREETCSTDWMQPHSWDRKREKSGYARYQCLNCLTWGEWEPEPNRMVKVVNKMQVHNISLDTYPAHPALALDPAAVVVATVTEEETLTAEQVEMRERFKGRSRSGISMYLLNTLRSLCEKAAIPITPEMKKGEIVDTIMRVVNGK